MHKCEVCSAEASHKVSGGLSVCGACFKAATDAIQTRLAKTIGDVEPGYVDQYTSMLLRRAILNQIRDAKRQRWTPGKVTELCPPSPPPTSPSTRQPPTTRPTYRRG